MKIYIVEYGDYECSNFLAAFSTKEEAEAYLKPYRDLEEIYGEDCVNMFFPDINEVEVGEVYDELRFYARVRKFDHGYFKGYYMELKRVDYIPIEDIIKGYDDTVFNTASLDKETIIKEASEYFGEEVILTDLSEISRIIYEREEERKTAKEMLAKIETSFEELNDKIKDLGIDLDDE